MNPDEQPEPITIAVPGIAAPGEQPAPDPGNSGPDAWADAFFADPGLDAAIAAETDTPVSDPAPDPGP